MLQIIPDTNFLIYAAKYKLDLEAELNKIISEKYEIILLEIVREELLKIAKSSGEKKANAELALKILIHLEIKGMVKEQATPAGAKNADQALIKLDSSDDIIATMDKNLKKKFRHAGIISLRQKKYLAFV
jgi:rRNA-processing protein FCF1